MEVRFEHSKHRGSTVAKWNAFSRLPEGRISVERIGDLMETAGPLNQIRISFLTAFNIQRTFK